MNTDITKQMEMVLYRTEDDNVTVSALIKDETIWITQKAMAELFGVQIPAISKHLKNIFEQGELREEVVVSKMEIPTPHGAIPGKRSFPLPIITIWTPLFPLVTELTPFRQPGSVYGQPVF